MATYTITYTINTWRHADPSTVLDAAELAADDLVKCLAANDIDAVISDDGPSVSEVKESIVDRLTTSGARRNDWRGEPMTFIDTSGVKRVAIACRHYTGEMGYYGGVTPEAFARSVFSCGACYYFGEDIAELGKEVTS